MPQSRRSYTAWFILGASDPRWGTEGVTQRLGGISADDMAEAAREAQYSCPSPWRVFKVEEDGLVAG